MSNKIGRNAPCPCGSGEKYKKCCLYREDNPDFSDISKFNEVYREGRKQSRIKECIHPDKSSCTPKIVLAHSIQNNKILSKISDNGMVYMPCPKNDFSFGVQNSYGRKEATVFTGFCGYHDKTVFQPIEDFDFKGTEEQIFLFVYRAFALEYHRKKEAVRFGQYFFRNKPSIADMPGRTVDGKTPFEMAVNDYEEEKKIFDDAILNENYNILTSFVWSFDGFSHFAATGAEAPTFDFDGKAIQDLFNPDTPVRHIYLCVFPEKDKTYAIIAWLKEYDDLFLSIKEKLSTLTASEKKNYINNTVPIITENIAIKPSSWDKLSKTAKAEFTFLFNCMSDYMELSGKKYMRFEKPTYDLFSL